MPSMYHYSFTLLQRSYSLNIPGRTRDFPITVWVRYSSEKPTTPGGPLHPGRRRPRGLLTTPNHDAGVARSSIVFAFRPEEQRRRATFALAPSIGFSVLGCLVFAFLPKDKRRRATSVLAVGIRFSVLDVLSSCTFGDRTEGGVLNRCIDIDLAEEHRLTASIQHARYEQQL